MFTERSLILSTVDSAFLGTLEMSRKSGLCGVWVGENSNVPIRVRVDLKSYELVNIGFKVALEK